MKGHARGRKNSVAMSNDCKKKRAGRRTYDEPGKRETSW
jgi:hypothetical protein